MKQSLLWQMYPAVLVIVLLAMVLTYANVSHFAYQFYLTEKKLDLEARARLISNQFLDPLEKGDLAAIQELTLQLGRKTDIRLTLIDPSGKVIGESYENPAQMDNHLDRPEVQQALEKSIGFNVRQNPGQDLKMMFVAVRLDRQQKPLAVLRTSVSIGSFDEALQKVLGNFIQSAILVALILAVVSWYVIWRISKPLRQIRRGTRRFGHGDLGHRLPIPDNKEMASLARTINQMAEELSGRIETITKQRNEQEAVLSSMTEGVLAVDIDNRCISVNKAVAEMLNMSVPDPVGRTIQEVVRNTDLQEFIQQALINDEAMEKMVVVHHEGRERHLQAHGTILNDGQQRRIGAVIVLNDITEIHKLQTVRTDFVANVSHELKTPVTSIKGFIETLLDGAMERPEDLKRFLSIIARQTERLNSIIDDLLTLSRIEQQTEQAQIPLEEVPLRGILIETEELCRHRAEQKNIQLNLTCQENLKAHINPSLLQQAVVNLIDNAVKYSEPENSVEIRAYQEDYEVRIEVKDYGSGISKEHLPRLFERFFRVDKARSRKLGGTGLGLAIVKHIVQAHRGSVTIDSTFGKGSTFTIHLPVI